VVTSLAKNCRGVVTLLVFLQKAYHTGFDLCHGRVFRSPERFRGCRYSTIAQHCRQLFDLVVPFTAIQLHSVCGSAISFLSVAIAFDQLDFAIRPGGLFHLFDRGMRL